jgi:hypothetical protein
MFLGYNYRIFNEADGMVDESYRNEDQDSGDEESNDSEVPARTVADHPDTYYSEKNQHSGYGYIEIAYKWVTTIFFPWIGKGITSSNFWTAAATVVIAVATIIYTRYASKQWGVMNQTLQEIKLQTPQIQAQAAAAQKQLTQTETEWTSQQRPWVGLSQPVALPARVTFQVFSVAPRPSTSVEVDSQVRIKNFGVSPAFRATTNATVVISDNGGLTVPEFHIKNTCSLSDQSTVVGGSVIFPNGESGTNFEQQTGSMVELYKIQRIWLLGCISYWDSTGGAPHHTKFWIFSNLINPNSFTPATKPQELRANRVIRFFDVPIAGWSLLKTEAD